jgi:hypothetical protein
MNAPDTTSERVRRSLSHIGSDPSGARDLFSRSLHRPAGFFSFADLCASCETAPKLAVQVSS